MTTYKTSHPYSERAQHSRLRSTHEHKHQAPAAPRANLDNISEGLQHNQRTVRKAERALAVSVAPAQPLAHEKVNAAMTRPEKIQDVSSSEQSQRGRTSRQTDATKAARRAVRTTGLRLQQRWALEEPQYARTNVVMSSPSLL